MEIKTKHKKFNSFTDLYSFMIDSHLEEISVTMKYPDGTKSSGIMPIDMVLSFTSIEQIKTLDKELKELSTKYNEDGEIQAQLDAIEASNELKQAVTELVNEKLHG